MSRRNDDFSRRTKRALSARVGGLCSYPDCHALTSGPKHKSFESVTIGVAAHITAAQPGGPRYEASLIPSQRQSVANGIWMCQTHARLIDVDDARFTVGILRRWKQAAEARAAFNIGRPQAMGAATPHALDFSTEQILLARLGASGSSADNCVGIGFYVLTIINRSERPITIKEILLRYSLGGRIHETDSHVVTTETVRNNEKLVDTALVQAGGKNLFLMDWHNLRSLIADHNVLGPGSVLSGSAYFALESRDWSTWRAAKDMQLVVRDYWGTETVHPVDLPTAQVWSPQEPTLMNVRFSKDGDGKIEFTPRHRSNLTGRAP